MTVHGVCLWVTTLRWLVFRGLTQVTRTWWPKGIRKMLPLATSGRRHSVASAWRGGWAAPSRPGAVLGATDPSVSWAGLQGFLQAAPLIHLCWQYFFLFLLLTLVILLFIFTTMPEAMSIYQNCNNKECYFFILMIFLDKHPAWQ